MNEHMWMERGWSLVSLRRLVTLLEGVNVSIEVLTDVPSGQAVHQETVSQEAFGGSSRLLEY